MTRAEQIADAFEAIARVNHYMVGFTDAAVTSAELEDAKQILITRQNAGKQSGAIYKRLDFALDMVEAALFASYR